MLMMLQLCTKIRRESDMSARKRSFLGKYSLSPLEKRTVKYCIFYTIQKMQKMFSGVLNFGKTVFAWFYFCNLAKKCVKNIKNMSKNVKKMHFAGL